MRGRPLASHSPCQPPYPRSCFFWDVVLRTRAWAPPTALTRLTSQRANLTRPAVLRRCARRPPEQDLNLTEPMGGVSVVASASSLPCRD